MPSFAFDIHLSGATLPVGVSPPEEYLTNQIRPVTKKALIDTGATLSVLSRRLRDAWRLPPGGAELCLRPGRDSSWLDTYFVKLRFGSHEDSSRWFELEVFALDPGTDEIDFIIGMDVLTQLNMNWSGKKNTGMLAFKED